jgi:hypothetical protein
VNGVQPSLQNSCLAKTKNTQVIALLKKIFRKNKRLTKFSLVFSYFELHELY